MSLLSNIDKYDAAIDLLMKKMKFKKGMKDPDAWPVFARGVGIDPAKKYTDFYDFPAGARELIELAYEEANHEDADGDEIVEDKGELDAKLKENEKKSETEKQTHVDPADTTPKADLTGSGTSVPVDPVTGTPVIENPEDTDTDKRNVVPSQEAWDALTTEEQKAYVADHPNTKYVVRGEDKPEEEKTEGNKIVEEIQEDEAQKRANATKKNKPSTNGK